MRLGVDTNVLIYTHLPSNPTQQSVREFFQERLSNHNNVLAVTPLVLHEFVHVVTDARRFDPPVSMSDALATARLYLRRSNVECLNADEDVLVSAFSLLERHRLGRKRIADTLLAATLLRHDVHELITCNPSDFEVFEELHVIDPRR